MTAAVIVTAGIAAHAGGLSAGFVCDDIFALVENAPLHAPQSWSDALSLHQWGTGSVLDGRPLLSLSFAANIGLTGNGPFGLRAVNLLVHCGNALLLFFCLRRALELFCRSVPTPQSFLPAAVTAPIWVVHPLHTESVTYISQRAESLSAFFGLGALALWLRAPAAADRGRRALALLCCVAGVLTKESAIAYPVIILLCDLPIAPRGRESSNRRAWHIALLLTACIPLLLLPFYGETVADDLREIGPWRYLRVQPRAILLYARLVLLPVDLVTRRDPFTFSPLLDGASALLVAGTLCCGLALYLKRRPAGLAVLAFFVLLAPSSSVVPLQQVSAEHRAYIASALPLLFVVLATQRLLGLLPGPVRRGAAIAGTAFVVGAFVTRTWIRNADYRSPTTLWAADLENRPRSAEAHFFYASALAEAGRTADAVRTLRRGLEYNDMHRLSRLELGWLLCETGQPEEAVRILAPLVDADRTDAEALLNQGVAFARAGLTRQAIARFRAVLRLEPENPLAIRNLRALGALR